MTSNAVQNTNNQHSSIVSHSKLIEAKKEASGTAFGAQILSQSSNLEMANQANIISTQSLNIASSNSELESNINQIKFSSNSYGYSVDAQGFLGKDFNKAAGLPDELKIHKSTLKAIEEFNELHYLTKPIGAKAFKNIDMADTVKHYYNVFKNVIGTNRKSVYTEEELNKLPKGFSYTCEPTTKNGNYLPSVESYKVTNIYKTQEQYNSAKEIERKLSPMEVGFSAHKLDFSASMLEKKRKFNPEMSHYKTQKGYTEGGVFVGFLKSIHPRASDSGSTELTQTVKASSIWSITETEKWTKQSFLNPSPNLAEVPNKEAFIMALLQNSNKHKTEEELSLHIKELLNKIQSLFQQTSV